MPRIASARGWYTMEKKGPNAKIGKNGKKVEIVLGTPRPGTEVSRALWARAPILKESEKSPKGCPALGSPRVPKECATESEKSPKRV